MARDPEIWEDPLKFIPERYEVETTAEKTNPYSYIPFSAGSKLLFSLFLETFSIFFVGSRNCIGQKFAMLELKSTISKVLRNFHVSVKEGFEPQDALELVIKSMNGVMVKLDKRIY